MSDRTSDPSISVRKALIVENDTLVGIWLRSNLESLAFEVVGQAANAAETWLLFRQHHPSLVLMDIRLGDDDGIELSRQLLEEERCTIVMVSAYSEPDLIARAAEAGVFGYLVKPLTREAIAAQIEVALTRCRDQSQLMKENELLEQSLQTRKLVDRAKGILMKRLNLDEPAAHKRLQIESQKRRLNMAEIAKKVIESQELLGE